MVWTTGSKGLRRDWDRGHYYEELSLDPAHVDMTRLENGAPLLNLHNSGSLDAVVGVVERAWIDGNEGKALVRFGKDEASDLVFQKVRDRILRNVSVGYSVTEYTDVSGPNDEVPTLRATRWTPAELSIVPIGFDSKAQIRNEENTTVNEVEIIERSIIPQETEMSKVVVPADAQPNVDAEALKKDAIEAERTRAFEITKAVREAKLDANIADEYIQRGVSLEDARTNIALFAKYAKVQAETAVESMVRVETGIDETDKKRNAIVEATLSRIDSVNFKPVQGNEFNGKSFLRSMESIVKRGPYETDGQYAKRVMSSSDLPYILANSGEKSAQKQYDLQPKTYQQWTKKESLRNFKTADRVRSGDFASLEERQENGEFKRGSFGEEREQVALKEWGKTLGFTRRMLINDDLGEIQKVIGKHGSAIARLENRLAYAQLTASNVMGDSVELFHSGSHGNVGTTAVITAAPIGEAFKLMREQTSVDGLDKLNLAPKFMIVGPVNEILARQYLATISPAQSSHVNLFSNSLQLIVDSEISSNDYFFAADPNSIDTVSMFYLEGEESPRVESRTNFDTEEVEIKVAHSCVAKALDWRGLVKNEGGS